MKDSPSSSNRTAPVFQKDGIPGSGSGASIALPSPHLDWRNVFQAVNHPTLIIDRDHRIVAANQASLQAVGLTEPEILEKKCYEIFHSQEHPPAGCPLERMLTKEEPETEEMVIEALQGVYQVSCTPVREQTGLISQAIHIAVDITARKQSELALRVQNDLLNRIMDTSPAGIIMVDGNGRITFANSQAERVLGLARKDLLRRTYDDPEWAITDFQGEALPLETLPFQQVMHTGRPVFGFQHAIVWPDGRRVSLSINAAPLRDDRQQVIGMIATVEDIGERLRLESALKESEEKYRRILDSMEEGYYEVDLQGRHTFYNDSLCRIFGYTREEFAGMSFQSLNDPEGSKELARIYHQIYESGVAQSIIDWDIVRRDGSRRTIEASASPHRDDQGQIVGFQGVVRDITERKETQRSLEKEKEKFQVLVEQSPLGVSLIGADGRYQYVNPKFTELFGYSLDDIPTGRDWFRRAFPDPATRRQVIEIWKRDFEKYPKGESRPRTFTVITRDGTEKLIQFKPVTLPSGDQFVIYEDITEQKKLEEQFLQAQKMEAIGTLAGGIAHDFNNLLTGILGHTSLMRLNTSPAHLHYGHLTAIEEQVKTAADLTRQLLGFARGGQYEVKPTDINELLRKSLGLFGRTRKEITVSTEFQEQVWTLEVDPGQMTQVFLNLFVNAWQAMPNGGELFIRTANITLSGPRKNPYGLPGGRYVLTEITDTGQGMDAETQKRIFEPFFTTKEMGRGTGLGLATVYGIIKNHGGAIQVKSRPGKGSTFFIALPAVEQEVKKETEGGTPALPGRETILLVDDEELILTVGKEFLEQLGYRIWTAGSGREALERYTQERERIDLVILDMVMPEMGGKETFFRLKQIDPGVKVLLASGYSAEGPAQEILSQGCLGFIQKPLEFQALSLRIREIFD